VTDTDKVLHATKIILQCHLSNILHNKALDLSNTLKTECSRC